MTKIAEKARNVSTLERKMSKGMTKGQSVGNMSGGSAENATDDVSIAF